MPKPSMSGRTRAQSVFKWLPICCVLASWGHGHATVDLALRLEASLGRNSNLFRNDGHATLPVTSDPNVPTPAFVPATAANTRSAAATVGVGMPLGSDATRLTLTSQLGQLTFSPLDALSNKPSDHTAQLTWRWTDLASGQVAAGRSRAAYVFDDTYSNLDMVTRDWRSATFTLKATPSLEFPVQVSSTTLTHADQPAHGRLDTDQSSLGVSALYRSPTGSTAQVGLARTRTRYPGRQPAGTATGAQERDTDAYVELQWVYSVKTQATARLTNRQKQFADAQSASKNLTLYRLSLTHTPSPMTRIDAQVWRQPIQSAEAAIAYGVGRGMGLGLTYTPSPKTSLSVQAQKESQTDELFAGVPALALSNPETTRLALRAQYELARGVNLFMEAAHEKRTRRVTQQATQNVWRVGLDYNFENVPGAAQRTRPATPFQP